MVKLGIKPVTFCKKIIRKFVMRQQHEMAEIIPMNGFVTSGKLL